MSRCWRCEGILVPFVMGKYQQGRFTNAKGQCDRVRRKDGKWFLLVTVDLPDGTQLPTTKACRVRRHELRRAADGNAACNIACRARAAVNRPMDGVATRCSALLSVPLVIIHPYLAKRWQ